ncbi:glycosyl hydrolase [Rhodohalobacter sp. 614A]|uniref:glycosyl hydrolase n=1 Tax=Rhodohalobacter sp. 614A TaxID=2908649 RepID=UPI001F430AA3|nr:glycosyl hydrolase [Rhodohalobacter sp. 614A]
MKPIIANNFRTITKHWKIYFWSNLCLVLIVGLFVSGCFQNEPEWPEITQENKPWTRWWWMGSAVNATDLTRQMELLSEANLGGVEITPIYGVGGYEDQFIDFLSPEWMDVLEHTLSEGDRLNLGIDMATGTGWPFGGPWIGENEASKRMYYKTYQVSGGQPFSQTISFTQETYLRTIGSTIYELYGFLKAEGEEPQGTMNQPRQNPLTDPVEISDIHEPLRDNENLQELAIEQIRFEKPLALQTLMAYSDSGDVLNLTGQVDENGHLEWEVPPGNWTLYALFEGWHGKMVERAGPGGEGLVIDHFSEEAFGRYITAFDSAFADRNIESLRSFFNDSYEVDDAEGEANWTLNFFDEFEEKRGYDLRTHLHALLEQRDTATGIRVLTDYRETISDLLLEEFTQPWNSWAEENNALIRNQAHGSPANILDLYAASDIPETEGTDIIRAKMASSAGNVSGKKLISAEAATWLGEHFSSSLSDVKRAVDRFFISGINHIFYHGTAYSPEEDEWPGWLFYAAVHFNERNPFWNQFADFNSYVARVQSFLQSGKPDNDILFYYPIHDQWAEPGPGLLRHFDGGMGESLNGSFLKTGAEELIEKGYTFDFISDAQLQDISLSNGKIESGDIEYQTIVIPESQFIPLETFNKLIELADNGATIIAYGELPKSVPGIYELDSRQKEYTDLIKRLEFNSTNQNNIDEAAIGEGRLICGDGLKDLLQYADIPREPMVDEELQFVRRSNDTGHIYFITNWSDQKIDGWIPLSKNTNSAYIFDPLHEKTGYAALRNETDNGSEIYLQLDKGESVIVQTLDSGNNSPTYPYVESAREPQPISGSWTLSFIEGGPELPSEQSLDQPVLWTELDGEHFGHFSGTAHYSITFNRPSENQDGWLLDVGDVYESATVYINGERRGTLFGPEYNLYLSPDWLNDENELIIEISNLMANRIAWMERENLPWKKFYNVNFPSRMEENRNEQGIFDASGWSPKPSGMAGPVTLVSVKWLQPSQ